MPIGGFQVIQGLQGSRAYLMGRFRPNHVSLHAVVIVEEPLHRLVDWMRTVALLQFRQYLRKRHADGLDSCIHRLCL